MANQRQRDLVIHKFSPVFMRVRENYIYNSTCELQVLRFLQRTFFQGSFGDHYVGLYLRKPGKSIFLARKIMIAEKRSLILKSLRLPVNKGFLAQNRLTIIISFCEYDILYFIFVVFYIKYYTSYIYFIWEFSQIFNYYENVTGCACVLLPGHADRSPRLSPAVRI